MLRITPDQMAAFSDTADRNFLDRVVAFMREHFPDASRTPAHELRSEIATRVRRAQGYGLEGEREIVSYLLAAKCLGNGFDRATPIHRVLTSERSPVEKGQYLDAIVLLQSAPDRGLRGRAA